MTKLKIFSTVVILSAVVAAPVLAQDASVTAPIHHGRAYDQQNFRGSYNQLSGAPFDNAPQTRVESINRENFGFSGRNPQRVGGENPDLNPSGS